MTDRADLSGKTVLVTGANAGIGLEIARGIALTRAKVVIACRSKERGEAARDELRSDTCNDAIELGIVDLSSKESIAEFAAKFLREHSDLHVLVNNAGVWMGERKESVDGIELTFATNVLGYQRLTNALLDLLKSSAPARIVNMASKMAYGLDASDLEFRTRPFSGPAAYAQSKQANRMLTWVLADKLDGTKVVANAVHPGLVATDLPKGKGIVGKVTSMYFRTMGRTPTQGADTAVWLATSDDVEMSTGNYYVDRKITKCKYRDQTANEALWESCERMG